MTREIRLEESWALREDEGLVPHGADVIYAHPRVIDTMLVQAGHLDTALERVLDRVLGQIEVSADVAIARLDDMVDEGNRRQLERHMRKAGML